MSVKLKMIAGLLLILIMVCVQSFLIVSMNSIRDEISTGALVTFHYNTTVKDLVIYAKTLETDILFKILGNEAVTENKSGVKLTDKFGADEISVYFMQWYEAFTDSHEYGIMNEALKQKVLDMKPMLLEIRAGMVAIKKLNRFDQAGRIHVYSRMIRDPVRQFLFVANEFVGQNAQYYSVTNKSLRAYSGYMSRNQAVLIFIAILLIIFIIFYSQYVLTPLNWLMEGIRSISRGDFDYKVRVRSKDELGLLAEQFNTMTQEIQNHRYHLEELVVKRTTQLIEANKSLETARHNTDLDMKMAINIQSSFYLKTPPDSAEWDIAFNFIPMSGVSGDLYDFYTGPDGTVTGVSLMDVSGHGVSSALITMLAKSVLHRNFTKNMHLELAKVVELINADLIVELGRVDRYYLSGIILRFDGNKVTYVNAGHPDMLLKSSGGEVRTVVDAQNPHLKGFFLGIAGMTYPYHQIEFEIASGQTLLLFTDCICESYTAAGELLGMEGVEKLLKEAPTGSAAETVRFITDSLYELTGTKQLCDDFTVVALRRK